MNKKFVTKQCSVFILVWFAYGSCYFLRKQIGLIKDGLQQSFSLSDGMLGYLDFAYAIPYVICSITLNFLGDVFGARKALGFGMIGSAVACSIMGEVKHFYELCLLFAISGSLQALCWPSSCSIVCSWFSKDNVSTIMAIYGSCMLVGSIVGTVLIVELKSSFGWRNVFLIPSLIVGSIGVITLFCARSNPKSSEKNVSNEELNSQSNKTLPKEIKIVSNEEMSSQSNEASPKEVTNVSNEEMNSQSNETPPKEVKKLTFLKIFCIPTLPEISFALMCTKALKTAVSFWLPLYLMRIHGSDEKLSGLIPIIFEFGGLIGCVIIVTIFSNLLKWSDLFSCLVSGIVCFVGFPMFLLTTFFGNWFMYALLFITGAFSSVIEIVLCGSIPSKIGEKLNAKSSVVGVINGIGSLGNGIEGPIVAWLSHFFGIQVLVYVLSGFTALACLGILKAYISSKKLDIYKD